VIYIFFSPEQKKIRRIENYVMSSLAQALSVWNDSGRGEYGLYFVRKSFCPRQAEAQKEATIRRAVAAAIRRAQVSGVVVPTAATDHAVRATARTNRISP